MIKTRISKNLTCRDCHVQHLCIAKDIPSIDLDGLDQLIKNLRLVSKKEHIYQINQPMLNLYAIYQGTCKEYWIDENGNECITNFYLPGDIIGIESVSREKYMFSTLALEDMQLCAIPINEFLTNMQHTPSILKRFVTITTQKMQHDQSIGKGITANQKVCDFLLNIAMRTYERNPQQKQINLCMSQIDMSNFLGITAETINRIFNILKRNKIIELNNKTVEIINMPELKKLSKLDYTCII
jgi:CRP/FNR family transcriptional regulator